MADYRDRNVNYVPDDLYLEGQPHYVEIAPPRQGQFILARTAYGLADELNREARWPWADVSGDGTHWSEFRDHQIQIDIELHTAPCGR